MSEPARDFGTRLRLLREAANLSLGELARRTLYSKGHLSKIENGRARPNSTLAVRCDEALETGGVLAAALPPESGQAPPPPGDPRPLAELPRDTVHFFGRDADLESVIRALSAAGERGGGAVSVCLIFGMGGVGKTALAVRAAHRLGHVFPDGCLFIDLHGYADAAAVDPADALERLLRRLGVDGAAIPRHVEDRAACVRDRLAGKRMLLFLDNARGVGQVLSLLPGSPGCGVLITSRECLRALEDVHRVPLRPLPEQESMDLFIELGTSGCSTRDFPARAKASEIVARCGGLPLALRIASARLRSGPEADPDGLADYLAEAEGRLDGLDDGERSLTAVFAFSSQALPHELRRTFMLLGLHPGTDFGADAAMALSGLAKPVVRRHLRLLFDASLITQHGPGRFGFHDLLRLFARDLAATLLPDAERAAAITRVVDFYLHSLDLADRIITPQRHRVALEAGEPVTPHQVRDYASALQWAATERENLVAVCRAAHAAGLDGRCWRLGYALRGFLFVSKGWDTWLTTHELALAAAHRAGDLSAEAATHNNLGLALLECGDHAAAGEHYESARSLFRRLEDRHGEHTALAHRAWVHYHRGDLGQALRDSVAALEFAEGCASSRIRAIRLRDTALIEIAMGRYGEAISRLNAALEVFAALALHVDRAMTLNCLGEAHYHRGDPDAARDPLLTAARLARACGSAFEEARAHDGLGLVAAAQSDPELARAHWRQALGHYTALFDTRRADRVRAQIERRAEQARNPSQNGVGMGRQ